jgi:adenosylcobinamide-phosphate synthase
LERRTWRPRRRAGIAHVALLLATAAWIGRRAGGSPATSALVVWVALGGRSLERGALTMAELLRVGNLPAARAHAPVLVGRDPRELDAPELCRATIESVAENTADALVAALLWGALAGAPGVAVYRATNTLDAMIGHRSPRYERFGWAAARLDDLLTWPAARVTALLTVLLAPLAGAPTRDRSRQPLPARSGCASAAPTAMPPTPSIAPCSATGERPQWRT